MSKDPFQELVDELTALRRSIEHIARTSLDKDEAKKLNQIVTAAVMKMAKAAENAPGEIQGAWKLTATRWPAAPHKPLQGPQRAPWPESGTISTTNAQSSHRPLERPVERHGAGLAGSGCGWPLCSPQGPLSGRWRWHGLPDAVMPASSGSFQAFIAAPQADRWSNRTTGPVIAPSGSTGRISENQSGHSKQICCSSPLDLNAPL